MKSMRGNQVERSFLLYHSILIKSMRGMVIIIRNPNGYGSVVKLSGNRRNPYAVRKTVGWNAKGYPIYKVIGYFPTREAGMIALAEYNKTPWDIDAEKTTLEDLYNQWLEMKSHKLGESSQRSLKSAYKHTRVLHSMKYKDIKSFHMQDCIDNCGRGASTQAIIKNLFWHLDRFALELDIINKSYVQLTTSETIPESTKTPFTDEEIAILWQHQNEPWVDSILIFLYTGFRRSELLNLEIGDIDLEQKTFKGGVKTTAGKNRIVPIHSSIQKIVERRVQSESKYFINFKGNKLTGNMYYDRWQDVMQKYNMNHTPHECRHTFRSKLDSAGANKRCIDMMMGHKSKDVGERIYTHKTIDEVREAIELIK